MGIAAKHAYRFGFLKSEKWQNFRLERLAKADARCKKCGHRSLSNDVHHLLYPPSHSEYRKCPTIVLCRSCHEQLHKDVPDAGKNFKSVKAQKVALGITKAQRQERRRLRRAAKRGAILGYALTKENEVAIGRLISALRKDGATKPLVIITNAHTNTFP